MNLFVEDVKIGDVVKITMQDPSIESGQWIETTVLSKAFTDTSLSLIVDLSGICFTMARRLDCGSLEFKGRVKIAQTPSNGYKVVGYAFDLVEYWGEWDVSIRAASRRTQS